MRTKNEKLEIQTNRLIISLNEKMDTNDKNNLNRLKELTDIVMPLTSENTGHQNTNIPSDIYSKLDSIEKQLTLNKETISKQIQEEQPNSESIKIVTDRMEDMETKLKSNGDVIGKVLSTLKDIDSTRPSKKSIKEDFGGIMDRMNSMEKRLSGNEKKVENVIEKKISDLETMFEDTEKKIEDVEQKTEVNRKSKKLWKR